MANPLAEAVAIALAELNRAIGPIRRTGAELRMLGKLKFSPADEKRLVALRKRMEAYTGPVVNQGGVK